MRCPVRYCPAKLYLKCALRDQSNVTLVSLIKLLQATPDAGRFCQLSGLIAYNYGSCDLMQATCAMYTKHQDTQCFNY